LQEPLFFRSIGWRLRSHDIGWRPAHLDAPLFSQRPRATVAVFLLFSCSCWFFLSRRLDPGWWPPILDRDDFSPPPLTHGLLPLRQLLPGPYFSLSGGQTHVNRLAVGFVTNLHRYLAFSSPKFPPPHPLVYRGWVPFFSPGHLQCAPHSTGPSVALCPLSSVGGALFFLSSPPSTN